MKEFALAIGRRLLVTVGVVVTVLIDPVLASRPGETESIKTDAHPRALLRYFGQGD